MLEEETRDLKKNKRDLETKNESLSEILKNKELELKKRLTEYRDEVTILQINDFKVKMSVYEENEMEMNRLLRSSEEQVNTLKLSIKIAEDREISIKNRLDEFQNQLERSRSNEMDLDKSNGEMKIKLSNLFSEKSDIEAELSD